MAGQLSLGSVSKADVDTVLQAGCYGHGDALFTGGSWGLLVVFNSPYYKYYVQLDFNFNGGVYYRTSTGNTWSEWFKL